MFDCIVIGDSVIDTYIPLSDVKLEKDSSSGSLFFFLPLGQKVPVGEAISLVAGNGANVSVGLSRLGLNTAVYTNVGNKDDEQFDDRIKAKLKSEGVDLRYVVENEDLPSNHNIVLTYQNERTILTHHQDWNYVLPDLELSKSVYLTSLSPSVEQTTLLDHIVTYLERTGAKLFFQPGTFQIKMGVKKQARLFSLVEILIVNLEEAKTLLEIDFAKKVEIKKLLRELADLGPKKVVITDGKNGSYSFDGEDYFTMDLFPAKLVEMTGAGDGYASGVVAGLLHGKNLSEAMRWGSANSAGVVEEVGPQKGLLEKTRMEEVLKKEKAIIAKGI